MGNPKFPRRKYDTPKHPWKGDRIKLEKDIVNKFGLKNKREVWKAQSLLRKFRQQARLLNARLRMADVQAEKEKNQLMARLTNMGLLKTDSSLNEVLVLELETILNRRLQTQVYLKGLAHTAKQARQFIVHGHISVSDRKVTIPGYLVKNSEEESIVYNPYSSLTNELHPMRPKPTVEMSVGDGQVSKLISLQTTTSVDSETKSESGAVSEDPPVQKGEGKEEKPKGSEAVVESEPETTKPSDATEAAEATPNDKEE